MVTPGRQVRKDALRNRALLLAAADDLIRERGLDLSLNAVAHHAGVGVGTVYRHFPDRETLIQALFEQRLDLMCSVMRVHAADEDPIAALRAVVFEICEMQAHDRGSWEVLSTGSRDRQRETVQTRLLPLSDIIVERANASGRLRIRFETSDLPVLLWTGGALQAYLGEVVPGAWQRYVHLLLDSYLVDGDEAATPPTEPALTMVEIDAAMRSWQPGHVRRD